MNKDCVHRKCLCYEHLSEEEIEQHGAVMKDHGKEQKNDHWSNEEMIILDGYPTVTLFCL